MGLFDAEPLLSYQVIKLDAQWQVHIKLKFDTSIGLDKKIFSA